MRNWRAALYARILSPGDPGSVPRIGDFARQHFSVDHRTEHDGLIIWIVRDKQHFDQISAKWTGPDHRRLARAIVVCAHHRRFRRPAHHALQIDIPVSRSEEHTSELQS